MVQIHHAVVPDDVRTPMPYHHRQHRTRCVARFWLYIEETHFKLKTLERATSLFVWEF